MPGKGSTEGRLFSASPETCIRHLPRPSLGWRGSFCVLPHLIPSPHIPLQSEAEGLGESREIERGTPSQTGASERPSDSPKLRGRHWPTLQRTRHLSKGGVDSED